jgi:tripartite-type tricarboxylate transporter receptor subunit TctC
MKKIFKFVMAVLIATTATIATATQIPPVPKELQDQVITMVVPWNPGGDTDATQRFVVEQVRRITGLNITIQNRAGARAIIGGRFVAEAAANGLTLLGDANTTHVLNPILEKEAVDTRLLQPVTVYGLTPQFFYVAADSKLKSAQDLVKLAQTKERFTIGCNNLHQCMFIRQFFDHYGIKVYAVLFRTPVEMATGLNLGDIDLFAAGATSGAPLVQANIIKAIAVTWPTRLDVYPDAEPLGKLVPGYRGNNFQMLSVPSGTPKHIVEYYNQVFRAALKTPESIARFSTLSIIPMDLSVADTERLLEEEFKNLEKAKHFTNIP